MLRQRGLKSHEELLEEAARIERLMAAGWTRQEIAKGLGRTPHLIDMRVKSVTGKTFDDREAEITREVFEASIRVGRSVVQIYDQLKVDESGLHARLRRAGYSIGQNNVGKPVKRIKRGGEAARVAEIDRFLAAGWTKSEIAGGLGLSVGGLEKFYYKAAGTSFRERENQLALEVTHTSVWAGRSSQQIRNQLKIDETTLYDRLERAGTSLSKIEGHIKSRLENHITREIRRLYAQEWDKIPGDVVLRWRGECNADDLPLYYQAFHHLMDGNHVERFIAESGIDRDRAARIVEAVQPTVKERRHFMAGRAYNLLEVPAVTEKQGEVFRLIAVEEKTYAETAEALGESSVGVTAIKKALIEKFPQLTGILRYHENSQ